MSLKETVGLVDPSSRNTMNQHLLAFLGSTLKSDSALSKLRGFHHILRLIWTLVCDEWWELHIARFPRSCLGRGRKIPELLQWRRRPRSELPYGESIYPADRTECSGCPVAVVAKNVAFPSPAVVPLGTFEGQESECLYVNMMPFDLYEILSLPPCCQQYWPMIRECARLGVLSSEDNTVYLTIDERPVQPGKSQRRPGLHVESPGFLLQLPDNAGDASYTPQWPSTGGNYVPGLEHGWGRGLMMRQERVAGGIFMASNVANTTAVWNCQIHDEDGDFIGPHGDIERFRELLGPCARTLEAGELIWMTDRTPHESLPVPLQADGNPARRQYFRLVIGTVTALYADHSTPNPLGYPVPASVRVVHGNKHTVYLPKPFRWPCGEPASVRDAHLRRQLYTTLCKAGAGHCYERFLSIGVTSVEVLLHFQANTNAEKERHSLGVIARKIQVQYLEQHNNRQQSTPAVIKDSSI